jgi:hypothetical protein
LLNDLQKSTKIIKNILKIIAKSKRTLRIYSRSNRGGCKKTKSKKEFEKMKNKKFYTDYYTAAHWGGVQMVLVNDLPKIDPSIWDNMRFEIEDENGNYTEIYQFFITNQNYADIEWMESTFDLKYTFSDLLDCWVLCVDHFGTAWKGVPCKVFSTSWAEINADLEYKL